jgi:hypothetical protein
MHLSVCLMCPQHTQTEFNMFAVEHVWLSCVLPCLAHTRMCVLAACMAQAVLRTHAAPAHTGADSFCAVRTKAARAHLLCMQAPASPCMASPPFGRCADMPALPSCACSCADRCPAGWTPAHVPTVTTWQRTPVMQRRASTTMMPAGLHTRLPR